MQYRELLKAIARREARVLFRVGVISAALNAVILLFWAALELFVAPLGFTALCLAQALMSLVVLWLTLERCTEAASVLALSMKILSKEIENE